MGSYKELKVWQEAHELVLAIYKVTHDFPDSETYSLTSQIRRAAVSIPANIAEGQGRISKKECLHFLSIARGSAKEVEYLVLLCKEIGYINVQEYKELTKRCEKVLKMLNGLIKSI